MLIEVTIGRQSAISAGCQDSVRGGLVIWAINQPVASSSPSRGPGFLKAKWADNLVSGPLNSCIPMGCILARRFCEFSALGGLSHASPRVGRASAGDGDHAPSCGSSRNSLVVVSRARSACSRSKAGVSGSKAWLASPIGILAEQNRSKKEQNESIIGVSGAHELLELLDGLRACARARA